MATVRVFIITYRRPKLLRRALDSLLAQTFTDWVCELHNDDPNDPFPSELVLATGDDRIRLRVHPRNFGAVASFNLAHAGSTEPFFSILEDDNWWEPSFLERMVTTLSRHSDADLAWANMRLWREEPDGTWTDTGEHIWPVTARPSLTISWPQLLQFDSPLYSNGAMLARSVAAHRMLTPECTPLDIMENVRERGFRYPLVFVPEPLANFSITLQTARSGRPAIWAQAQTLLAVSFLKHVSKTMGKAARAHLWTTRRMAKPPATSVLIFAGLLQPTPGWLGHAHLLDWLRFLKGVIRHPRTALAILRARASLPDLAAALDTATASACARPQGDADIPPFQLSTRADLADARD